MKFIIIILAVILLITFNTYPSLAADEKLPNLQELSDKLVEESSTPGLVLLVHSPDGTLEIAASGIADLAKKNTHEKRFPVFYWEHIEKPSCSNYSFVTGTGCAAP
jgi:hypothetical protein